MAIDIRKALEEKSPELLEKWLSGIEGSYPAGAAARLSDKDKFRKPAAHAIAGNAAQIVSVLLTGSKPDNFVRPLDEILRLRAVQDLTPSQAVGFIFNLKEIIRAAFAEISPGEPLVKELRELEDRIDALVLLGFDIYESCRLQIFEVRMNELKRLSGSWLREHAQENGESDLSNNP